MKTQVTPIDQRPTPSPFELAQIAATLGAFHQGKPEAPATLVARAMDLWRAAVGATVPVEAQQELLANTVFDPLIQKDGQQVSQAWEKRLLAYPGDRERLADLLGVEGKPTKIVLRQLFRSKTETVASRNEGFTNLVDYGTAKLKDPLHFENKTREKLGIPERKFLTVTDKCLYANTLKLAKDKMPERLSIWACRWLVVARLMQISEVRAQAARRRGGGNASGPAPP